MKRHKGNRWQGVLLGTFLGVSSLFAQQGQTGYQPTPENLQARQEFSDSKFGIFLHWGIYSMFGQGEWYMETSGVDCHEYAKAASGFYPSRFNAKEWVAAIKASGAKYICITTRHHDGFSMFDTRYSDYDIIDATPFKRDIIKELAEECQKQGIKLHLYYSHLDWTREDYYPYGYTGHNTGRTKHGDWNTYYQFMNNQLTELLTNYGPVGAIWFDGVWDHWEVDKNFDWRLGEQYALIHKLQPACLIGNNHHKAPYPGEDFQMFERDLPGENKAGFSGQSVVGNLPLETCETMNGMWGYKIKDQNYKSVTDLVRLLVRAAGKGANLLMNIGPQPDGELPAVALERLAEVGEWMKVYGKTIYGTRGGCIVPHPWGVTTQRENKLYVHILELQDKALFLPLEGKKVRKAVGYADRLPVKFRKCEGGVMLYLPEVPTDIDKVIEVEIEK